MKLIYLIPLFIYSALDAEYKQKAYRKMVQNYSHEEKKIWEDFHYGLFLGSRNFVERIKSKYLTENPDVEIPQKRQVLNTNPETILKKAAKVLKCDTDVFLQSSSSGLGEQMVVFVLYINKTCLHYD